MPKIDNIEETPNPNAIKFILKEPVTSGAARSFHSANDAESDPLAKALFEVGNVASVFYMDRMITVEKDYETDWDELLPKLAVPIRAAESVTTDSISKTPADSTSNASYGQLDNDDPRLNQINEILNERIRPALASDGGWLEVVDLKDHTLSIRYQGACGTCPSSITGTLMAIEGMIRQEVDPEIEVVAI
jgi:NFU1 iron-sulfur cluster scaffold homolog, mitochondrial